MAVVDAVFVENEVDPTSAPVRLGHELVTQVQKQQAVFPDPFVRNHEQRNHGCPDEVSRTQLASLDPGVNESLILGQQGQRYQQVGEFSI
jgi:hypothetical protein